MNKINIEELMNVRFDEIANKIGYLTIGERFS